MTLFSGILLIGILSCSTHVEIKQNVPVDKPGPSVDLNVLDTLDAVVVAPESHEILLENDRVRVLRVTIDPGVKEPMHTHQWESIMMVTSPARIRYYLANDLMVFESPDRPMPEDFEIMPNWMQREGIHAVENIDSVPFVALRVELKD